MAYPFWRVLPPPLAHRLAPLAVKWASFLKGEERPPSWHSKVLLGQSYPNPLGVAAGFDKNAYLVPYLFRLGFGFVEIGTVTPRPQGPNPGRIVDRDWSNKALWNKMGFPSEGAHRVASRLEQLSPAECFGPLWINIGKNRDTPSDQAVADYVTAAKVLQAHADVFVVNISSPNTSGLRDLQSSSFLESLAEHFDKSGLRQPVLIKLSPDLEEESLWHLLESAASLGFAGVSLTNTTLQRPGNLVPFPKEGGVSGRPLASLSVRALEIATRFRRELGRSFVLVSAGGIMTHEDIKLRAELGADLFQVYSVLAFEGFYFAKNMAHYFRGSSAKK